MITSGDMWLISAALLMMCADVVSGFLKACLQHDVSSTKMRAGLLHKAMLCVIVGAVAFLQVAAQRSGYDFGIPALACVCGYVCIMEFASVVENVAEGYPEFQETKLYKLLKGDSGNEEDRQ